jgi:hypothetical protein
MLPMLPAELLPMFPELLTMLPSELLQTPSQKPPEAQAEAELGRKTLR